jgi:hypothetical protein
MRIALYVITSGHVLQLLCDIVHLLNGSPRCTPDLIIPRNDMK